MILMSRFMARRNKLSPAETYNITVIKNREVPMSDGIILRSDLWPTTYPFKCGHRVWVRVVSRARFHDLPAI